MQLKFISALSSDSSSIMAVCSVFSFLLCLREAHFHIFFCLIKGKPIHLGECFASCIC